MFFLLHRGRTPLLVKSYILYYNNRGWYIVREPPIYRGLYEIGDKPHSSSRACLATITSSY